MKNCFRIEKIFIFFLYGLCEAFLQTANTPCEKKICKIEYGEISIFYKLWRLL